MAQDTVGTLIIGNYLPTQQELINKSITRNGVTTTFDFPLIFRLVDNQSGLTTDFTYLSEINSFSTPLDSSAIQIWSQDSIPFNEGAVTQNKGSIYRSLINNNNNEPTVFWNEIPINSLITITATYK